MTSLKASGSFPTTELIEWRAGRDGALRQPKLRLVLADDDAEVATADERTAFGADYAPSLARPITTSHRFGLRRVGLVGADLAAIVLGLAGAAVIVGQPNPGWAEGWGALSVAVLAVAWVLAFAGRRLYLARYVESRSEEAKRIVGAGVAVLVVGVLGCYLLGVAAPTRDWAVVTLATVSAAVMLERSAARVVFRRMRADGRLRRRIAIVGTDEVALALCESISRDPSLGYEVVGLIGATPTDPEFPVLGDLDHALAALEAHGCVGVIVSIPSLSATDVNRVVRELNGTTLHVALSTTVTDIDLTRLRPQGIDGHVMLYVEPALRSGWRAVAKRIFDVVVAGALLVVTLPVMFVTAVLVRFSSPGPVLFRQVRVGRDGENFEMLKFRTMVADAEERKQALLDLNEADGPLFKMQEDPRVTRVGRTLRKWSIDELPQLWNVLRGEMSMVGPRPALPDEVAAWDPDLRRRLTVPPGITGEWQVSGRSDASFATYRRRDLYYVDNWTLTHDIGVCLRTALAVVRADGAK